MEIQDQIIALLQGELKSREEVNSLLLSLSASPEHQETLLKQVAMSRTFSKFGHAITPSATADQKVLNSIPGLANTAAQPFTVKSFLKWQYAAIGLLLLLGVGTGYFLGHTAIPKQSSFSIQRPAIITDSTSTHTAILNEAATELQNFASRLELPATISSESPLTQRQPLQRTPYHPRKSTAISGIINQYAAVLDIQGTKDLLVQDNVGFNPGDKILLIQMQGADINESSTSSYGTITDYQGAGLYEFGRIDTIVNNHIQLKAHLLNSYSTEGNVQIVRVPEYEDVSINGQLTCSEWNGTTGGILVFSASGVVKLNAPIDVSNKGFRGGIVGDQRGLVPRYVNDYVGPLDAELYGMKGEGIAGYGIEDMVAGRGAPANGGGGGSNHNAGGGGGANSGCGGNGGYSYRNQRYQIGSLHQAQGLGGYSITPERQRLFLGGGGGGGHSNFSPLTQGSFGTNGGNGGGVVLIEATTIISNGYDISADGASADGAAADGAGGGGAGGSILLAVEQFDDPLSVSATGGNGGNTFDTLERADIGTGGGGGGGSVYVIGGIVPHNLSVSLQGGMNGVTINNSAYGATPGCNGIILPYLELPGNLLDTRSRYRQNIFNIKIE